ncbi:MAG: hypothetical protein FWE23_05685 [Chitinivibrionia bacterium]|nr:hypothetical protein [Chitinivibrionia bacterium]
MRKIIFMIMFCASFLFASPIATNVMRELRFVYQTQKADMFIEAYLRERRLSDEQVRRIRERMDFFFNSNIFLETGAAYLAHFFSERELMEIYDNLRFGTDPSAAMRRMDRLFRRLDPFLFDFLRQNVFTNPQS